MDALCGCILIPDETERFHAEHQAAHGGFFAAAYPELAGTGEGQDVFLWDAEIKLFGKPLPTWVQQLGTCTGMGFGRGLQDTIFWALAFGGKLGRPNMRLAWEPWYAASRTRFGRPSWRGDGSCPPWLAQAAQEMGLIERATYGSIDLTRQREDLAQQWGNRGVPQQLQDACGTHKAPAALRLTTKEQVRDCIASGRGVARCADRQTGKQRDANGMSRLAPCGGHCELWRASFYDFKGRWCVVEQQSWPDGACPAGGGPLKLRDGLGTRDLPQGAAGLFEDDVDYCLAQGEVWCVDAPLSLWSDPNARPSDLLA